MRAGNLGVPVGEESLIRSTLYGAEQDGTTLKRSVSSSPSATPSGQQVVAGEVAVERRAEFEESEIGEDGTVRAETRVGTVADTAEFLQVPGEFLLLEPGAPGAAWDVLGDVADCGYEGGEVDIDGFLSAHEDATLWMLGFYERGTRADTGTVYGSDLGDDPLASDILETSRCNQVGFEYEDGGETVRGRLSQSGYVEVYSPDYDRGEFVEYVVSTLLPHVDRQPA